MSKILIVVLSVLSVSVAAAPPDRPLAQLPYSPSLDLTSMDAKTDPCVDFYQYSCGGWMRANPIPADQASWSVYGKLEEANLHFLWGLLEAAAVPRATRNPSEQKIGDHFASCMDEAAIEAAGATPIRGALEEIAALRGKEGFAAFLGKQHLTLFGGAAAFDFGSNQDFGDSTQVIAFIEAGGLGLPDRDYYTKTDRKSVVLRKQYLAHVTRMFALIGEPAAAAAKDAQIVLELETALARPALTLVQKRDPHALFHKMGRAQLGALTPLFRWDDYLTAAGVADLQVFNVTEPAFMKALNRLVATQSLDRWKTYLRWHTVLGSSQYLSKPFQAETFDFFSKTLHGIAEDKPRWKKCVRWVDHDLGEALGRVFADKTFAPETKAKTVAMTKLIEEAMADEIRLLPWMSQPSKQRALDKLSVIANKVGYPDRWRDYGALTITRGDFFGNGARGLTFEARRQLTKIGKPVDRGEWQMTPPTVNAYYNPQMNDINFPAAVLQPPLYDPKLDDAPNYGNTGSTIGHELTHGFDDEGRQFDGQGNLKDWWTPKDEKGFNDRLQCVKDQFAGYTVVDDIKINSKLTAGEDVADLGGTLIAYAAWKKAARDQKAAPIDGLSPDQRFFIGFAQWACENNRPENLRVHAATDPHSPGRYRINGIVSNLPAFGAAFSCKPSAPMVRATPCKVW